MFEVFVAYASGNNFHGELIRASAESASTNQRRIIPWSARDTSGYPISDSVETWIQRADAFVGDVSVVNDNVTYEIGYAIGAAKPVRLIRSENLSFHDVKTVGLLDTLGHDPYSYGPSLQRILAKDDIYTKWPEVQKSKDQPVFILQPSVPLESALAITSAVKKIARLKFRNFNPLEVSRLSAAEAYEQVASSYGVITFWEKGEGEERIRNNQRAAFVFGLASGKGVPSILLAHEEDDLPLDLHDLATRWKVLDDIAPIIRAFRDDVADLQVDFVESRPQLGNLLQSISCGDPTAENEASDLADYFLETEAYQRALNAEANVIVGRKGSGKTAVFLQVRDRTRVDKNNIVIDLMPDGHQLIKLKEFILDQLGLGARKEVIAAFWQYVMWLEVAYKLLEKDGQRALRDHVLLPKYRELESLFKARVDTGAGDFSERLRRLSENVIARFGQNHAEADGRNLDSSEVIRIIYGEDLHSLREAVSDYLRVKGFVFFLFDNLDRFWTPGGFDNDDALIVVGLTEAMQEITRRLRKARLDFRWVIFVRSDVYEFLVRGMADYGKLSVQSLEWIDRDLLLELFKRRVSAGVSDKNLSWRHLWDAISTPEIDGRPALQFLLDGSLMRPRYLIRLFETARRRAITFGRTKLDASDYQLALTELGWQVMEDLDREIADLVPNGTDLLFEIVQAADELSASKFRYIVGKRLQGDAVDRLLGVMLWNGSLGVVDGNSTKFIFDCGYKRQYLAALIDADSQVPLKIHPTLLAAMKT
jgi:hypothetical protein